MPFTTPPVVYILHGDDDLAIDAFLSQLTSKLGDPATAGMNTTRLESKALSLSGLRSACLTAPFLARRRLVIVEGFLSGFSSRKTKPPSDGEESSDPPVQGKEILKQLLEFLPEIPASTALVLLEKKPLPPTHPALRWAGENPALAYVKQFLPPKGSALPAWILRRAQAEGGEFTPQAAQMLASVVGDDPRLLSQEILKLLTHAGFARAVTPEDIAVLTPESVLTGIFDMVDAIGGRDGSRALRLLRKTVDQGNVGGVFAMVVRQFRLLLLSREALDSGIPAARLASALNVHPFVAQKLALQARNFNLSSLEQAFRRLRDIDESVKSGRIELDAAMETLVAELAS
ncbi:MAG: DNA polymerase III subunit delta [Anaerolineales bacterium]|nr:DNA polymerase III subunit delta [Anaerolineales bacterium]